jgi:hypothetical protein
MAPLRSHLFHLFTVKKKIEKVSFGMEEGLRESFLYR